MNNRPSRRKTLVAGVSLVAATALGLTACGSSSGGSSAGGSSPKVQLSLVAYSVPQAAFTQLIKAFQATPAGKNVTFSQSYGASGDQSRAVAAGLKADVVNFALSSDVDRLVKANLVAADWNAGATKGIVTDSVVGIATRKGNPKGIKTWDDLTKSGVEVITPNPFTSGGARWNIMAAYGAASSKGTNDAAGLDYLSKLFKNVPVQDDSARKALQTFTGGKGDALLDYEDDLIFAQKNGAAIDYTIPSPNILIENPIAVTSGSKHPAEAKAFVDFVESQAGQQIWANNGFRPVVTTGVTANFPTPAELFTISDLGGWSDVTTKFFDPDKGALVNIEKAKGVSVKK